MKPLKHIIFLACWIALLSVSCRVNKSPRISGRQQADPVALRLADSILQIGLDHEALYTIIGKIKPISSVTSFRYNIANDDSLLKHKGTVLDTVVYRATLDSVQQLQNAVQILNNLQAPDLKFILVPYQYTDGKERYMEVMAVRPSLLDSLLKKQESFFGQFGFVSGADPGVVVNTVEFEDRYERLRAYGYLFGYPNYAVDFFVEAAVKEDPENKHVARDFFPIPVYARKDGYFVYAIPKGHQPTTLDSNLYKRAMHTLDFYKIERSKYLKSDSTLRAMDLLIDYSSQPSINN